MKALTGIFLALAVSCVSPKPMPPVDDPRHFDSTGVTTITDGGFSSHVISTDGFGTEWSSEPDGGYLLMCSNGSPPRIEKRQENLYVTCRPDPATWHPEVPPPAVKSACVDNLCGDPMTGETMCFCSAGHRCWQSLEKCEADAACMAGVSDAERESLSAACVAKIKAQFPRKP